MRALPALPAVLALAAAAAPAAAHDLPHVEQPPALVVVQRPWLPEWGRTGGEGAVRVIHHDERLAARVGVADYAAWSRAYDRALTRLSFRMPVAQARAAARHHAFHAVVGRGGAPEFVTTGAPAR